MIILILGSSCRKNKIPIYTLDDIEGHWKRVSSSKPIYDSIMIVSVSGNTGTIDTTSLQGYFTNGTVKWRDITPDDDSSFIYRDLGSDNSYYDSKMTYIKNNPDGRQILFLEINANGEDNGSWQYWEKL